MFRHDNNSSVYILTCILAYNKSIALLYDKTKLILNEPFFTSEECHNLNWPSDNKSVEADDIFDSEDISSILRKYMYNP